MEKSSIRHQGSVIVRQHLDLSLPRFDGPLARKSSFELNVFGHKRGTVRCKVEVIQTAPLLMARFKWIRCSMEYIISHVVHRSHQYVPKRRWHIRLPHSTNNCDLATTYMTMQQPKIKLHYSVIRLSILRLVSRWGSILSPNPPIYRLSNLRWCVWCLSW